MEPSDIIYNINNMIEQKDKPEQKPKKKQMKSNIV